MRFYHALLFRLQRLADTRRYRRTAFQLSRDRQQFLLAHQQGEYYVVLTYDQIISRDVYVYGHFEFGKVEKAIGLLGTGFRLECLVDIGANIGTVCIPAIRRGLAQRAIAIEPDPTNYRVLVANTYLNDVAAAIACHNMAFGAEDGQELTLELSRENSGDHQIASGAGARRPDRDQVTVRSGTLDGALPELDPGSTLIWMDTQGYEGFILAGAPRTLARRVPLVVEYWPQGMQRTGGTAAVRAALLGYRSYYDLSQEQPQPVAISPATLDALWARIGDQGAHTDLLVV